MTLCLIRNYQYRPHNKHQQALASTGHCVSQCVISRVYIDWDIEITAPCWSICLLVKWAYLSEVAVIWQGHCISGSSCWLAAFGAPSRCPGKETVTDMTLLTVVILWCHSILVHCARKRKTYASYLVKNVLYCIKQIMKIPPGIYDAKLSCLWCACFSSSISNSRQLCLGSLPTPAHPITWFWVE